jgi:hypothetical protein
MTRKILHSILATALVIEVLAVSILADKCQEHKPTDVSIWFSIVLYSIFTIVLAAAVRLVAAIFSRRIRTSIAKHPVIHLIWFGFVAAFFILLFFARAQTRTLSFNTVPPNMRIGCTLVS